MNEVLNSLGVIFLILLGIAIVIGIGALVYAVYENGQELYSLFRKVDALEKQKQDLETNLSILKCNDKEIARKVDKIIEVTEGWENSEEKQ